MVDERPEEAAPPSDPGRPRREPPTIDLKPSEISGATKPSTEVPPSDSAPASESTPEPEPKPEPDAKPSMSSVRRSLSQWIVAPLSGAVAAGLVVAAGWAVGWPALQMPPPAPQASSAAVDDLAARVAGLESKTAKGAGAPDPGAAARTGALEKSLAALRGDLAGQRAQSDKLAAAVSEMKSTPRDPANPTDISALNERIARLEGDSRALVAQMAEIDKKSAQTQAAKEAARTAADDLPLRRLVAAALLDVAVRHGDPFAKALATAKTLDACSSTGIPNPAALSRELLALVPKLSPPATENVAASSGIVERLQAGAAKLVRIERTDAVGSDRGAVVARITAAALRNDLAEARRELASLSPADREPAQAWLDKAAARDAALAASRQFADDAMTALATPAQ
jgi:hypothetical protein